MDKETLKDKIYTLISQNNLSGAIEELVNAYQDNPYQSKAVQLSARLKELEEQIRNGLIDHYTADILKNRLRKDIITCTTDPANFEQKGDNSDSDIKTANKIVNSKNVIQGNNTFFSGGDINLGDQN